jgi:hypothetical protein
MSIADCRCVIADVRKRPALFVGLDGGLVLKSAREQAFYTKDAKDAKGRVLKLSGQPAALRKTQKRRRVARTPST